MTEARYDLVFRGKTLPDFHRQTVMQAFADTFAMAPEKAAAVFRRNATTLKRNLDRSTATRYQARLAKMGMHVEMSALTPAPTASTLDRLALEPTDEPASVGTDNATDTPAAAGGQGGGQSRNPADEQSRPEARLASFRFSGDGNEYFGVWIVNILLSVLTLGIYSAWAKVRNKQYFYGHTELEGSRFDYTASPGKILFGRAIALVFFIAYSVALELSLASAVVAWVVFIAFLPWAVRQALRFNARHSQYRNVPFRFNGSLVDAFLTFIVWPLLGVVSLGALFPMALQRQQAYILGNHCYGTRPFKFSAPVRAYYGMALWLLVWLVGGGAVIGALVWAGLGLIAPLLGLALYFVLFALFSVTMANLKFNHTTLARHGFLGAWEPSSYVQLVAVNSLATVFTLGLFTPWAKVRTARYAAEHTQANIIGDLEHFAAAEAEKTSAIAEGVGDLFDLEVGV